MKYQRKAFTMIELVFVIVILGILSSVAISKMAVTRDDAELAKGRAQVAGIRNAIVLMRNTNMLQAMGAKWPSALDDATTAVGQ
ncbi:MAG TPA: prepilin-type N-terminal cleavage/methylation domain-containing protein [Campylobacterales bacterium]|nr:prepilin-type N-terminal cleavage/methylation domain-containing protein [Campylobacterales bacterium]